MKEQNSNKYTAVICAAGQSKRMGVSTKNIPKALLAVGDKTILEHLLDNISECGLERVVIITGYLGEMIKEKIRKNYRNCRVDYVNNENFEITDNFYSLYLAKEKISSGMIFFNADIIFNKNILSKLIEDPNDNSLAVVGTNSPGAGKNPVRVRRNYKDELMDIGHDLGEERQEMVFGIYKLSAETTERYFRLADDFFKDGPRKGGFWFPLKKMIGTTSFKLVAVDNNQWVSVNTAEEYANAISLIDFF
ncbi:MAG: phosphocholine cytidylyltransferase family protein [Patescibacteria group bacterium]